MCPTRLLRFVLLAAVLGLAAPVRAQGGPEPVRPGVHIALAANGLGGAVRLAHDPSSGTLVGLFWDGRVFRLAPPFRGTPEVVYTAADHGLGASVVGLTVAADGTIYLVGNETTGPLTAATVVRGRPGPGGTRTWTTVVRTEPYPRSNTAFDHTFNGIAVSPDGQSLYLASGSRTDHGERQENGGLFPDARELPLTSAVFRVPADATDLVLPNDAAALAPYLFADGFRNAFDLAFDGAGRLFGAENAGDRDDSDELNWIRAGRHYGFPWRIGLNDTPQQFPGYDPTTDRLLNPAAYAVQGGFFYDDPTYPPRPPGVAFTDPVLNRGPDANLYRDPVDGSVRDAGDQPVGTFTAHRSPLGLAFDTARALPAGYTGDGFVLSWTGSESPLLQPFAGEGEDLLHLALAATADGFEARVETLARGFLNPIDVALVGSRMYVLEYGQGARIWEVALDPVTAADDGPARAGLSVAVAPNPVSGAGRVVVRAGRTGRVTVDVVNVLGQRVGRLFDAELQADEARTLTWNAAGAAPGTYLIRVASGLDVRVRLVVVAR